VLSRATFNISRGYDETLALQLLRTAACALFVALALAMAACGGGAKQQPGNVATAGSGGSVAGHVAESAGASGASSSAGTVATPRAGNGTAGANAAGASGNSARAGAGAGAMAGTTAAAGAGAVSGSGSAGTPSLDAGAGTAGSGAAGAAGQAGTGGAGSSAPKKFVGNITTSGMVRSDFVTYWDQITPENEGKWGSVEGTRNQMNWAGVDAAHKYAKDNGFPFKQHTFVWGSQQPNWLGGLSPAEQKAEVEEWIRLFCERYPDVALIDVVNEPPPHTTPVYLNALGGAGSSGYDWIVQSFKWARQYCPNAILILNDYNNIEYAGDNTRFIDIVKAIQAAGAPIDAVGAQAHDAYKLSTSSVQGLLDKLASSTGLPVYITEYDIDLADDNQQKDVMQSQLTLFWNDERVKGVTLWGYVVGATWKPNTGLIRNNQPRPALTWLMQFLGR
jgi:endo-1,4-beta-xylanase